MTIASMVSADWEFQHCHLFCLGGRSYRERHHNLLRMRSTQLHPSFRDATNLQTRFNCTWYVTSTMSNYSIVSVPADRTSYPSGMSACTRITAVSEARRWDLKKGITWFCSSLDSILHSPTLTNHAWQLRITTCRSILGHKGTIEHISRSWKQNISVYRGISMPAVSLDFSRAFYPISKSSEVTQRTSRTPATASPTPWYPFTEVWFGDWEVGLRIFTCSNKVHTRRESRRQRWTMSLT